MRVKMRTMGTNSSSRPHVESGSVFCSLRLRKVMRARRKVLVWAPSATERNDYPRPRSLHLTRYQSIRYQVRNISPRKNMNTLYSIYATGFQIIFPCQWSLQNSPPSHSTSQKSDYHEDFLKGYYFIRRLHATIA